MSPESFYPGKGQEEPLDKRESNLKTAIRKLKTLPETVSENSKSQYLSCMDKIDSITETFIEPVMGTYIDQKLVKEQVLKLMLVMGGQLLIIGEYERMQAIADKNGFGEVSKEIVDAALCIMPSQISDPSAKIDIPRMIASKEQNDPLDSYDYIMGCIAEEHDTRDVDVSAFKDNPSEWHHHSSVRYVAAIVSGMLCADLQLLKQPDVLKKFTANSHYKSAFKHAESIFKQMELLQSSWRDAVVNPKNPRHKELVNSILNRTENGGKFESVLAVDILFSRDNRCEEAKDIYRTLHALSSQEGFEHLTPLCEILYAYVDEQTDINIFSETFIVDKYIDHKYSSGKLKSDVSEIRSKTKKTTHNIDPESIEWKDLPDPQELSVEFSKNDPNKFTIQIGYLTSYSDVISMEFYIDLLKKHNFLDWNFLESPNNPEMKAFKGSVLLIIEKTLTATKSLANAEQEARKQKKAQLIESHQKVNESSNGNQEKQPSTKLPDNAQKCSLKTELDLASDSSSNLSISIPCDEDWKRITTNGIVESDIEVVKRAIEKFNENNSQGNLRAIKMKKGSYRLKAGPKLVVVLKPESNGRLTIEKVFPRKIDYKRGVRGLI